MDGSFEASSSSTMWLREHGTLRHQHRLGRVRKVESKLWTFGVPASPLSITFNDRQSDRQLLGFG